MSNTSKHRPTPHPRATSLTRGERAQLEAIEAQFLMGHWPASAHLSRDRKTIENWSWDVDHVRQQLHVPANALWDERVLSLEMQGLATFTWHAAPVTHDEDGNEHVMPGWEDDPREEWGSLSIHPHGVLRLAEQYGRSYVRCKESPALLAHWQLVQAESAARLHTPYNPVQWEREWPERAILWKAWLAEHER